MSSSTTDRVQRRVQRQIAFHLQRADVLESCLETPGLLAATIHRTAAQELQEVLHDITDLLADSHECHRTIRTRDTAGITVDEIIR